MRHWWQLATRNWRIRAGRSALSALAITLGVGLVVWVTCCYESVRRSINDAVLDWIGRSHIIVEPVEGVWATFSAETEQLIASIPGVAATTTRTREYVEARKASSPGSASRGSASFDIVELSGVVPERELDFRNYQVANGRFLQPGDAGAVIVEKLYADELRLRVGDTVAIRHSRRPEVERAFRIIGIVDRRRASANQAPMLWATMADVQDVCGLPGQIKAVDVLLKNPDTPSIREAERRIRETLKCEEPRLTGGPYQTRSLQVKTTQAQLQKLEAAQRLLRFIMTLLSCVVLLTAFFIILASISMGVAERVTELGLLRCIGGTRRQVAGLIVLQAAPLAAIGIGLGLPLGLGLQWLTIRIAGDYVGRVVFSPSGIWLGIAGGLGTTLLGALLPAIAATRVSPAEAARSHAASRLQRWIWLPTLVGLMLLAGQELLQRGWLDRGTGDGATHGVLGLLLLYGGFALISPMAVVLIGGALVRVVAVLLRLRPQLLGEEIDRSPFRCGAICSGLMVGLSLIFGLVVWGRSVKEGWQFPREFPDALLYSYDPLPLDAVRTLKGTPHIAQLAIADDFSFSLSRPSIFRPFRLLDEFSRFLAIEPEEGFAIAHLTFLEGSEPEAMARLKSGGHVLITREFSEARAKHLGDHLTIWVDGRSAEFTIAGVVASPGLDIAISFFNATTYFQTYAVGALIGTLADAEKFFGRRYGKLILINFDLPAADQTRIAAFAAPEREEKKPSTPGRRPSFALGPGPVPGDGPEERVVNDMLARLGHPSKAFVTARELKRMIDRSIDRVTLLLAAIPLLALFLSALGLANVMAANLASRARQIAILRAVGLTRGQLVRMVIGEALIIAMLGGALGLVLGLGLARYSNAMTAEVAGLAPAFTIPWALISVGTGLATALCILAAWIPARRAGRASIVSVLSES